MQYMKIIISISLSDNFHVLHVNEYSLDNLRDEDIFTTLSFNIMSNKILISEE